MHTNKWTWSPLSQFITLETLKVWAHESYGPLHPRQQIIATNAIVRELPMPGGINLYVCGSVDGCYYKRKHTLGGGEWRDET